jgi:hypothetical protein
MRGGGGGKDLTASEARSWRGGEDRTDKWGPLCQRWVERRCREQKA